ncbi:hypothetical protein LCGC14_1035610 [marine sediment metagenome]|uniref:Uncharacterized protein n=1 Tax=marine sediment metagenome TaxID=412755 RepID=A0A0F9QBJ2_9ZZZZ
MVERLNNDPLNYLGVRERTPPSTTVLARKPDIDETSGINGPFAVGDVWLDTFNGNYFIFFGSAAGVADWRQISL